MLSLHKYHIPSLIINFWLYNPPSPIYRSIYLFKQKIYPVIIPPPLECKSPPACIEIWIRLFTTFLSLKMWSNSKKYYGYKLLSELLCDLFYNTFFSPRWPHFEGNGHNMCSFLSYKKINTLATSTSPRRLNWEVSTHYATPTTPPWVSQNHMTLTSGICLDLSFLDLWKNKTVKSKQNKKYFGLM